MRRLNSPKFCELLGGPHASVDSVADIDGGKMDGFVAQTEKGKQNCGNTIAPECAGTALDVMGYHTQRELPNYWKYAQNFVLLDNLFEPVGSYHSPSTPVYGVWMVGTVQDNGQSHELQQ